MAKRTRRPKALVGVTTAVLLVAPHAHADSRVTAWWAFSSARTGPVAPGTAFGAPALYAAGDRTDLAIVQSPRGSVLDVASWRGLRPGVGVARNATTLSTDPAFWMQKPWGSDGTSTTFDPGTDNFSVSVWLTPTNAQAFPRGTKSVGSVSPNVVQKGTANTAGGFWKVSLQMVRTAQGLAWAPECVLRGRDGVTVVANRSGNVLALPPATGARITCARVGNQLILTVVGDDGSVRSSSVGGAGAIVISNRAAVSVAHKPGTTSAHDVYDGLLADLVITRG